MNFIVKSLSNRSLRYIKFTVKFSTQTHFGFQTVDEDEKSKKGI